MPTLDTTISRRSLPTAADIAPNATSSPDLRRVRKIIDYVELGRAVWWRRGAFHTEQFQDAEPKWHVLASRMRSSDPADTWTFTWSALCGWQKERPELIFGMFAFRATTPKRDIRCRKCVAALATVTDDAADGSRDRGAALHDVP